MVSVSDILVAFSDEESLSLFSSIAIQPIDADTLRNKISLTRKQYYSRMHRLTKSNLIKKNEGKVLSYHVRYNSSQRNMRD